MENPTFEESLQELEKIVVQLEQGDVPLEKALDAFKPVSYTHLRAHET